MDLHYASNGSGPPLIILHGLYGQGDNWLTIARHFSEKHLVFLVDQRNHGKSCHQASHTYSDMALDLLEFCRKHELREIDLIGHSMGGKTAMTFALTYPGIIRRLIIVDISPYSYLNQPHFAAQVDFHRKILKCFLDAPLAKAHSRTEIEYFFEGSIEDVFIRKFLLKNLRRTKDGKFYWQLNAIALSQNLEEIVDAIPPVKLGARSFIPALFLRGGKSPYIPEQEILAIPDVFKNVQFETFENAGHWLHFEEPQRFIKKVESFLAK